MPYATRTEGTKTANAFASSSSSGRIGVVRNGSRVPWSRSPITEYAAMIGGITAGTTKRSNEVTPTERSTSEAGAEAGMRRSVIIGEMRKTNGRMAIVATRKRLRQIGRAACRGRGEVSVSADGQAEID